MTNTLISILNSYILTCRAEGKSSKTIRSYRDILTDFISFVGDIDPKCLDVEHIRLFMGELPQRKGRHGVFSTHSTRKYYNVIRTFIRWMFVQRYIEERITDFLRPPKQSSDLPDLLSTEEIEELFALLEKRGNFRDQVIFEIFLDNGIRLQELTNLNIDDVDLAGQKLTVHGKGKKERIVPIGMETAIHLHIYINAYRSVGSSEKALFVNRFGRRLELEGLSILVRRILSQIRRSGKCGAHILRHTFATEYLRNGGNLEVLRRILGHGDIRMTQRYIHLNTGDLLADHAGRSPVDARRR